MFTFAFFFLYSSCILLPKNGTFTRNSAFTRSAFARVDQRQVFVDCPVFAGLQGPRR